MLYAFLKVYMRLAMRIFCRKIRVDRPEFLEMDGPVLIAMNHPNSFLDAVIIDILFKQPVWSLARGDVFKTPFVKKLLHSLKMFPVYRTSEGTQNLESNYDTFNDCLDIFREKGFVLIFSEGRCINEWHLRPLKKGTARLAMQAWQQNIPLKVLPVGINYNSFSKFGKNIFLHIGDPIEASNFDLQLAEGAIRTQFNKRLQESLQPLVYEIDHNDYQKKKELLEVDLPVWKRIALFLPGMIGLISHAPFYYPFHIWMKRKLLHTDHYDSVMAGLMSFISPVYLALVIWIAYLLFPSPLVLLLVLILPFCAWSWVQIKAQFDR